MSGESRGVSLFISLLAFFPNSLRSEWLRLCGLVIPPKFLLFPGVKRRRVSPLFGTPSWAAPPRSSTFPHHRLMQNGTPGFERGQDPQGQLLSSGRCKGPCVPQCGKKSPPFPSNVTVHPRGRGWRLSRGHPHLSALALEVFCIFLG